MCDGLKTTDNAADSQPATTDASVIAPSFMGVAHTSRAKVLRTISGQTAGVDSRRGSFLVLVVGVLALLSVIAVLYATLGSSDRQRAQAVVRKQILDDYPNKVADYIAGVIAIDATGAIPERTPSGVLKFSRESFDYPFTDWRATNQFAGPNPNAPMFTPSGNPLRNANGTLYEANVSNWTPSDPYLATSEAVYLDVQVSTVDASSQYLEKRDWAHISNVGPDGRYVNLSRLRGNFDRASRALTDQLTIPGRNGDHPGGLLAGLDPHIPADFDSRQIGAFRPMFDYLSIAPSDYRHIHNQWADADGDGFADSRWFEMVDARNSPATAPNPLAEFDVIPRDPSIRYFVAARIVDLSGRVNVNTATDLMARPEIDRLIGSSPAEINLRGLLTMAYQADLQHYVPSGGGNGYDGIFNDPSRVPAPNVQSYAGYDYLQAYSTGHFGYIAVKLSLAAGVPVPPSTVYDFGTSGLAAGFEFFGNQLGDPGASFATQNALTSGEFRQRWDFDIPDASSIPPAPFTGASARFRAYVARNGATRATGLQRDVTNPNTYLVSNLGIFAEEDQLELLVYNGVNDPSVRSSLEMVMGGRGTDPTNANVRYAEYSPLRDNRQLFNERPERLLSAANDPSQWDPFMLARQLDVRQQITTMSWAREIRLSANVTPDRLSDAEVRINPIAWLDAIEFKARITTPDADQHQADIAFSELLRGYYMSLAPYVAEGNNGPGDVNAAWDVPNSGGAYLSYGHQGAEFALITSAFMAANMADKFDLDSVPQARVLILDHDYRAQLTADRSQQPDQQLFPYWHGPGGDADLMPGETEDSNSILDPVKRPERLLLASSQVRGDAINSPAINIYGVEPQVFVTGTTAFTVFTDAPDSARSGTPGNGITRGADDEGNSGTTPNDPVTIDGTLQASNADVVMRCVAFQLTNPFNVDIQLGANEFQPRTNNNPDGMDWQLLDVGDEKFPALTRMKDYFYLEFGGRQYALVRLVEPRLNVTVAGEPSETGSTTGAYTGIADQTDGIDVIARPITVPAGETVVVYALSQIPRTILQRMNTLDADHMLTNLIQPQDRELGVTVPRGVSPHHFHELIRKHIGTRGLGIGRPTQVTNAGDGRYDQDGVYWIPEFLSPANASSVPAQLLGVPGLTTGNASATGANFTPFRSYDHITTATPWNMPFGNLFDAASTNATPENQVVTLWRAIRSGSDQPTSPPSGDRQSVDADSFASFLPEKVWNQGPGYSPPNNAVVYDHNLRSNDMMVDRLRLPSTADFNRNTLLTGSDNVSGTTAFTDNTGLTITLWDSVHRPTDAAAGATSSIRSGSLPAYCIERKQRVNPANPAFSWNLHEDDDVANPPTRNAGMFTSAAGGAVRFRSWFDDPNGNNSRPDDVVIQAVGLAPWARSNTGFSIDASSRRDNGVFKSESFAGHRPELVVNNARYGLPVNSDRRDYSQCTLRTADMLAPLAVGAFHDPLAALPSNWPATEFNLSDIQWTPLSESFALSLGYETAPLPAPDSPCAVRALYPQLLDPLDPAGTGLARLFDKAQLKLDQYAAFFDANNDGVFTPSNNATSLEYLRGAQTPLAWNVLDTFSTRAGLLQDVTHGAVNINTASQTVLAALPLVAPATPVQPPAPPNNSEDPYLRGTNRFSWWWRDDPTRPNATRLSETTDLTATIMAVRDKMTAFFRPASVNPGFGPSISFDDSAVLMSGAYGNLVARSFMGSFTPPSLTTATIGEMPGFRTPGSVLMAKAYGPVEGTVIPDADKMAHNIDFLGRDLDSTATPAPADSSVLGVMPGLTKNWDESTNAWTLTSNQAGNDYQEQLAIAGAVVGTTTNRSDVFAVWFVVQGYTKEDVTGLAATDPMVPSVKRRFVMVVDRSNVQQTGDKPKILFLKEVPVD